MAVALYNEIDRERLLMMLKQLVQKFKGRSRFIK